MPWTEDRVLGVSSLVKAAYLLLQPFQHGSKVGLPVLLIGFHLLGQFFFRHLDEVIVLLNGFLDHLPLMFPFLGEVLQELSFLVLGTHKGRERLLRGSTQGMFLSSDLKAPHPEHMPP